MGESADPLLQPISPKADELIFGTRPADVTLSYVLPQQRRGTVFGYVGIPGEPAMGPPPSGMRQAAGLDRPDAHLYRIWSNAHDGGVNVFTVGYTWRDVTVERSTFSRKEDGEMRRPNGESLKLDSRSVRLSYKPSPLWTVQLSRGSLSGLDQLVPNADVRRTSISATYREDFKGGYWQTTLAWGRNSRKLHESTSGYLLESSLRLEGEHVLFGRVEQVGSDELTQENELYRARMFKLNKVSVGYFHDMRGTGPAKIDVGVLASRHLVPAEMTDQYGKNPISYLMFLRLKIK